MGIYRDVHGPKQRERMKEEIEWMTKNESQDRGPGALSLYAMKYNRYCSKIVLHDIWLLPPGNSLLEYYVADAPGCSRHQSKARLERTDKDVPCDLLR